MKKNIIHPTRVSASVIESRLGALVVWLMFVGLGLNIWPGWGRIAEWLR